jgi:hypothetical protein
VKKRAKVVAIDAVRRPPKQPRPPQQLCLTDVEAMRMLSRPKFGDPVHISVLKALVELEEKGWRWPGGRT